MSNVINMDLWCGNGRNTDFSPSFTNDIRVDCHAWVQARNDGKWCVAMGGACCDDSLYIMLSKVKRLCLFVFCKGLRSLRRFAPHDDTRGLASFTNDNVVDCHACGSQ